MSWLVQRWRVLAEALLCPEEDLEGLELARHFGAPVGWVYVQHGIVPATVCTPIVQGFGVIETAEA